MRSGDKMCRCDTGPYASGKGVGHTLHAYLTRRMAKSSSFLDVASFSSKGSGG